MWERSEKNIAKKAIQIKKKPVEIAEAKKKSKSSTSTIHYLSFNKFFHQYFFSADIHLIFSKHQSIRQYFAKILCCKIFKLNSAMHSLYANIFPLYKIWESLEAKEKRKQIVKETNNVN